MRYRTIVADPPWHYGKFGVGRIPAGVEHDGRATVGDRAAVLTAQEALAITREQP